MIDAPTLAYDRLDLPAEKIGFDPPPPCKLHLKFFQTKGRWSVFILAPAGKMPRVEKWLQTYHPSSYYTAPGIAPRVARMEFDALPDKLADLLNAVHVQSIWLHPEGVASVVIRDAHATVKGFVQTALAPGAGKYEVRVRESKSLDVPHKVKVTPRQSEALSLAVALGYYEVPHRIRLRDIAQKMDMSLGALSELLRRAESAVMHSFADHSLRSEWETMERQQPEQVRPIWNEEQA